MNKKLLLIALISISVFTVGCGNKKIKEVQGEPANNIQTNVDDTIKSESSNNIIDNTKNNDLESSKDMTYELVTKTYTNKDITVNYPQLTSSGDITKQKLINEIIEDEALKVLNYYSGNTEEVSLEINYDIKLQGKDLLSIQYSGIGFFKGSAHPNGIIYTTNINLNRGTRLRLSDLVKIDESFINKFKNSNYKSQELEPNEALEKAIKSSVEQFTVDDLIKSFNNADSLDNIGNEKHSDIFSYFTKDSLGISVSVAHALGDHAEFEIKYEDLKSNLKTKNQVWEDFLDY
jgi:hypothetical protein